jgi:hypothetical protein
VVYNSDTMAIDGRHQLDYQTPQRPLRRSPWRPVLDFLAYLSLAAIPISAFATYAMLVNPQPDIEPVAPFAMLLASTGCVIWWAVLRRRDRRA